ncbi:Nuclear pore complex protein NUP160 [Vitis vinifera]|uniref:Nuclear pore complex protein NUP160 n=1 Tax=Vitis vinifera TaxID=29760 RepID=A0A438E4J1_VITVI|nr:Nuclear pore complex protein NUP160 [Vitis vinifera]
MPTSRAVNIFHSTYHGKSMIQRPADIIHRKRPSAVWFPYTTIERLWCQLEEMISSGNMVDQCDKLKKLLHEALLRHLNLLKVDSDDALSSSVR